MYINIISKKVISYGMFAELKLDKTNVSSFSTSRVVFLSLSKVFLGVKGPLALQGITT
jgi:hypothetical protein